MGRCSRSPLRSSAAGARPGVSRPAPGASPRRSARRCGIRSARCSRTGCGRADSCPASPRPASIPWWRAPRRRPRRVRCSAGSRIRTDSAAGSCCLRCRATTPPAGTTCTGGAASGRLSTSWSTRACVATGSTPRRPSWRGAATRCSRDPGAKRASARRTTERRTERSPISRTPTPSTGGARSCRRWPWRRCATCRRGTGGRSPIPEKMSGWGRCAAPAAGCGARCGAESWRSASKTGRCFARMYAVGSAVSGWKRHRSVWSCRHRHRPPANGPGWSCRALRWRR